MVVSLEEDNRDGFSESGDLGGELALGHVDLALTVEEVDVDSVAEDLAVGRRVKDVADSGALAKGRRHPGVLFQTKPL